MIEALETEQAELNSRMADPEFFRQPPADIATATQRAEAIATKLDEIFERWTELSERE